MVCIPFANAAEFQTKLVDEDDDISLPSIMNATRVTFGLTFTSVVTISLTTESGAGA